VKKVATITFIIFSGLLISFSSCNKGKRNVFGNKMTSLQECVEESLPDKNHLEKIAKEINAEQKSFALDTLFKKRVKNGFNGAILVEQKGVLLYRNISGLADLRTKDSLNYNSTFQLASVSKTFTGIAVLQLVEEGKINLNDSIQKYIPDFPYKGINIALLLSHRSGLPNYLYSFENKRRQRATPPNNEGIINWFKTANPLPLRQSLVNGKFTYNNTNYAVLARIVEVVSGKPFGTYMRDKIFLPLGMKSTYIDTIAPPELLATKVKGYDGYRERPREMWDGVYGDKGIYSNVDDMLKWYHGIRSGCLLKQSLLDSAFIPRSKDRPSRHNYGYGFRLMTNMYDMDNVLYVYHGGWWNGFSNMFWMDVKNDYVIIVLSNKRNKYSYDVKPIISILEGITPKQYEQKLMLPPNVAVAQ